MAKLIIVNEEDQERVHELIDQVTTIGRSSSNTIQITDKKSSRNHFRIEKEGERFKVIDLGSTNGTRLNEERATTDLLCPGDVIRVGKTTFRYDGPGEARPPSNKPPPPPDDDDEVGATVDLSEAASAAPAAPPKDEEAEKPKYVLEVVEGEDVGKRYELGLQPLTIGRKSSNTIQLHDEASSSFHAEVKKEPIGYVISDLGSTNGTRAKARSAGEFEKIVKTPLSVGMKIKIGKTVFEYRNVGKAQEEDELFATVALDPEKLGDQIAERPAAAKQPPSTLVLGGAAVALFLAIVVGVVTLLPKSGEEKGPPTDTPPPPPRRRRRSRSRTATSRWTWTTRATRSAGSRRPGSPEWCG
ncbi:MAG: FHA domain-containing protein [Planctomycetota bacterium]|nr:FHA domain-containing protein [Planctomycetota bacterium]